MRYAILSDVHANVDALRAVLADAADMRAERVVCLGDVLGYGPEPVEALELVYRRAHICLAGNHDDAVSGRYPVGDFTDFAAAAVLRHRAMLARNAIDWLRSLPHTCEVPSPDGGTADGAFACAHGEFGAPERFAYVLEPVDALPSWRARAEQLLFAGHTHQPGIFVLGASGVPHRLEPMDFVLEPGKRYLVNVGSVGYPRGGVCRSFYCLYDDQSRTVVFRSLPFDLEGYRTKMGRLGADEVPWIAARARERKRGEVRGTERFSSRVPPPGGAEPPAARPEPRPALRNGWTFAVGAAALALGGVWCTVRLTKALREKWAERAAVRMVEVSSAVLPPVRPDGFAATVPLSSGWTAALAFPDRQKVQVDRYEPTKETVFRLTSGTNGLVRFTKRLSLFARPPKVYCTVRKLTSLPRAFTVRVVFFDGAGRQAGEDVQTVRRSRSNYAASVPAGVETAELRIECRFEGTCDFAVPEFRTEPIQTRSRKSGAGRAEESAVPRR